MKIVFDARIHLNYYSGISRYMMGLLEAYARLFPEDELQVLINPSILSDNPLCQLLAPFPNVKILTIDAGHIGPKNYTKMGRIIKKLNPDVYHYPHLDAPVFTGKTPVVATVHDANSNQKVKKFDDQWGLKSLYFKTALRLTLKRAKKVIFVSDSIRDEILKDYKIAPNPDKYIRIYNGFETDFNTISPEKATKIRSELNCQAPYLLFVGQIRTHKNIERVIAAYKQFYAKNQTYKLMIVGHNYLGLNLNEPNIQHIERVNEDELKALYAGCTALLFPSLFEGFGFPILEAYSFGKPVITSNYGATKEVSGDFGILVDPFQVDSIVSGIEKAISDDQQTMARINYCSDFSWENHVKALRKVYLDTLN